MTPAASIKCSQGLIQAVFSIGTPSLGALIWACPNLILSKTETTGFQFFVKISKNNLNVITRKYKIDLKYSLFGLLNDNIGTSLCYNLVG